MKKALIFVLLIVVMSSLLVACGHKHSWGEWVNIKDATCSENGLKERVCECGEKEVKEISATGLHSFGEWVIVDHPTVTSMGSEERICNSCSYKETKAIEKLPDIIYYSDLFYGYDTSYLTNAYIEDYYDDVDDVARDIFNDYINSDKYIWTQIETSIAAALSAREFFELISDANFDTNFNYTDAIDSANILFAKELIGETDSMKMIGDVEKLTKPANKIISICNDFEDLYYDSPETHEVIIEKFFDALYNSDVFKAEGKTYLPYVKSLFLAEAESAGLLLSSTKELISYLKAISVGLMLEELRIEILDNIVENSSGYKTVYDGMTRLKNQLVQGFASYVVKSYMQDKVVDAIFDAMQDAITGQIGAYGFVSTVLKTASWVAFDVLFDIPDMDDMLVQMVLNEYVDGFHFILNNKANSFKLQFDSDDISEYESLVEGFDASCRALLKASEKLTLSSNYSNLVAVTNRHKSFSYDNYIKVVKDIISATPYEERKVKKFYEWTINEATSFTPASDTIGDDCIYKLKDGFYGNLVINTAFNIDSTINIYGSIAVNKSLTVSNNADMTVSEEVKTTGYITVEEGASLTVNGNILISDGQITNNGTINAVDLTDSNHGYRHEDPKYYQSGINAVLNLKGNFTGVYYDFSHITAGTVIFSGTAQQTVQGLKAYNIEVLNPEGVKYLSNVDVYGTYDLNGNPLDNAEFVTNLYDQADIVPGSNYGDLYIRSEDKTFSYNVLCDSLTIRVYASYSSGAYIPSKIIIDGAVSFIILENLSIDTYAYLTINKNANVSVGKEVTVKSYLTIEEGVTFTTNGNITLTDGHITNNGTINAVDLTENQPHYSQTSQYKQNSNDATLNLKGNFTGLSSDFSKITAGTVIFSGTAQQTVQGIKAPTIIIENKSNEGVVFNTSINVSKLFNHKGNNFTLYNNGNGSTFVDYDGDGVLDNLDADPVDPNK